MSQHTSNKFLAAVKRLRLTFADLTILISCVDRCNVLVHPAVPSTVPGLGPVFGQSEEQARRRIVWAATVPLEELGMTMKEDNTKEKEEEKEE